MAKIAFLRNVCYTVLKKWGAYPMNSIYIDAVEKNRDLILSASDYIWQNPETGYREVKTSAYLENAFEALGYSLHRAGDIPGFYTVLDTGRPGPEILVFGELDALICPGHSEANDKGVVHCCGHNAQCAALLGIAAALREPGVTDRLCGKIRLCAVPAEELIERDFRAELIKRGVITHMGGKPEFLHRGYFDGVDMAFMVHITADKRASITPGSVGFITQKITYRGVSAHAGGAPWNGVNALYAANLGLSAINAVRETVKESDIIRVHPIITSGGNAVNAIPDKVVIESSVRGASFDGIDAANKRINRALVGAALSLGSNIEIENTPGYAPLLTADGMADIAEKAAEGTGFEFYRDKSFCTASSDMGDLSCLMPVMEPSIPGASGRLHGTDFEISDKETACIGSAKWQMQMLALLLENNAERAYEIIKNFKPRFSSKEEYFEYLERFKCSGERIKYTDNSAEVVL